jgi:parvulin-like peptidyl-prolyl isomerase
MGALLKVNGRAVDCADAIRRSMLHEEDFLENTITGALIQDYAAKKGISNSDQELQLAADELRYQRGLESVEKLHQWIKSNHQTETSLQNGIDAMLLRNKLRGSITDAQVETFFAEHRLEFDTVELYSCRLASEEKARELLAQVKGEGANFHVLTMEHSTDDETRPRAGYIGRLTRSGLTSDLEPIVFKAVPGSVVGPIKTEKGWNLFKVVAVHKASLESARDAIRMQIFQNLLTELRAKATVSYPVLESAAVELEPALV